MCVDVGGLQLHISVELDSHFVTVNVGCAKQTKKKKKKRKKSLKCCKERIGVASASGAPSCRCSASGSPASEAMGCGLRKLEDPEDSTPGKIYSTLKRPQVETKTETVYEYVLLDFSLEGKKMPPRFQPNQSINRYDESPFLYSDPREN